MTEDRTRQVLAHVRQLPAGATVDEIANSMDVHANTVRFHLARLQRDDLIREVDAPGRGRGRPPRTYVARHTMDVLGPRRYQTLAAVLLQYIRHQADPYTAARDAGTSWAVAALPTAPVDYEAAVSRLVEFLDRLDFRPNTGAQGDEITMRHCPFMDLIPDPFVCEIHRGLIDGALRGTPADVSAFEPFSAPGQCRTQLQSR